MITLSNNTKGLVLLHQVEEIYGKVYTSDSLLETVLYWIICLILISLYITIGFVYINHARAEIARVGIRYSLFQKQEKIICINNEEKPGIKLIKSC